MSFENEQYYDRIVVLLYHVTPVFQVIGAGVTLAQALEAAKDLESFSGISVRVMDPFTIKPLDEEGIIANALEVRPECHE